MIRFLLSFLSLILIACILVVVLSNRDLATLDLDLLLDPAIAQLTLPMWIWLFIFVGMGFFWGMIFSFLMGGQSRRTLRETRRKLKSTEAELLAFKQKEPSKSRALTAAAKLGQ